MDLSNVSDGTENFAYFITLLILLIFFYSLPFQSNTHKKFKLQFQKTLFHAKYTFFKNSFFPSTVIEWNELDRNLRSTASLSVFKKNLLNFIRPSRKSVFNCHNDKEIKYLTRLRLGLSHLCKHKFKHSFQDTVNPFCSCGLDVDTNTHPS